MTFRRLATSLLIAALGLAGITHWRASARETAAEAAYQTVELQRLLVAREKETP